MFRHDNAVTAGSIALVAIQFIGIGLVIFYSPTARVYGWPVLLLGGAGAALLLYTLLYNRLGNFSVFPELKRDAELVTGGPYRWVRHPMYGALLLLMAAGALNGARPLNALGLLLVVVAVVLKARREERLLAARFDHYADYAATTWRFIPFVY